MKAFEKIVKLKFHVDWNCTLRVALRMICCIEKKSQSQEWKTYIFQLLLNIHVFLRLHRTDLIETNANWINQLLILEIVPCFIKYFNIWRFIFIRCALKKINWVRAMLTRRRKEVLLRLFLKRLVQIQISS